MTFFEVIYLLTTVLMAAYGFNAFIMIWLYLRHRHKSMPRPPLVDTPDVTVQLPIYNELHVVKRLIDSAIHLDYPKDRLQIQVLDDSTDETTAMAKQIVERYQEQDLDIELIHRDIRTGFKAGALAKGLEMAKGEFVAVFDADFVPGPDFLTTTVPHFLDRPRLGMIQTRWGHINADYSLLTRIQAIALDGHFVIEQTARNRAGLFTNFNGTAGIWRRSCIDEAGGWQGDTISEDLDLSYRAQLAGWDFLFLPDVVSPAELPPQINAFKRQQFRWAKGSIQCAMKLWRQIVTAPVPLFKRIQGLVHLTGYLVHPLMLIMLLIMLPLTIWQEKMRIPLSCLGLASFGPPLLYALSQQALYRDWPKKLVSFPLLMLLGAGIALSDTRAIYEALTNRGNDFRRTPKFQVEKRGDQWKGSRYVLPFGWETVSEAFLALYALLTAWIAWRQGNFHPVPFMLLYAASFGYVSICTVFHSLPHFFHRTEATESQRKSKTIRESPS